MAAASDLLRQHGWNPEVSKQPEPLGIRHPIDFPPTARTVLPASKVLQEEATRDHRRESIVRKNIPRPVPSGRVDNGHARAP